MCESCRTCIVTLSMLPFESFRGEAEKRRCRVPEKNVFKTNVVGWSKADRRTTGDVLLSIRRFQQMWRLLGKACGTGRPEHTRRVEVGWIQNCDSLIVFPQILLPV